MKDQVILSRTYSMVRCPQCHGLEATEHFNTNVLRIVEGEEGGEGTNGEDFHDAVTERSH